jgi:nucleotide-binding universal stress UspA family protein
MASVAPAYVGASMVNLADARDGLEMSGRAILQAAHREAARLAPGVELTQDLDYADPADLLEKLSVQADLVVVGSHGRGPVLSKLLGSVSIRLVRHAHCPVVVVRPGNPGTVRNGVLVGLDALPESQPVLELAYGEASRRGLPLTVLHASGSMPGAVEAAYLPETPGEREAERLALAEAMAGMTEKYPDVCVTTRLVDGRPEDLLTELGDRMDLVVVGGHQAHGLERVLFGSVSVAVVEHAHCPVAVVPVAAVRA